VIFGSIVDGRCGQNEYEGHDGNECENYSDPDPAGSCNGTHIIYQPLMVSKQVNPGYLILFD
jgi:hypothetical protein